MTYIAPCHDCPLKQGCEQREEFRRRVKGLNAASVKFRCSRLTAELRPGRRIELAAAVVGQRFSDYWDNGDGIIRRDVPATITAIHGTKFACVIDPGHISDDPDEHAESVKDISALRFRSYQRHARIRRFLDEPDATLCEQGRIVRDGVCDYPKDGVCYCSEAEKWRNQP